MNRSFTHYNHYQKLGVGFRAAPADIKGAFRNLAKKYHPDQNPNNPDAEKKFREVKEAYDCLSNKLKRSEYDREWLQSGKPIWNPKQHTTEDGEPVEEETADLTRKQLVSLYAAIIGLPFLASLLRKTPEAPQKSHLDNRRTSTWNTAPTIPEVSPRDELINAFFNPLSRRWERLGEMNDPPKPLDLFKYTVKEHKGIYRQILQTVCLSPN